MGQRKTIEKGLRSLMNLGMTREEAVDRMREIYTVRLSVVEPNSSSESAIMQGLSVLSRITEKN